MVWPVATEAIFALEMTAHRLQNRVRFGAAARKMLPDVQEAGGEHRIETFWEVRPRIRRRTPKQGAPRAVELVIGSGKAPSRRR